jgi:hypothetical protein
MNALRVALIVAASLLAGLVLAAGPKITWAEFDRLSPEQSIDLSTRKLTKREFLAEMDRLKAQPPPADTGLKMTTQSLNAELARAAKTRITAANARAVAFKQQPNPVIRSCDSPRIDSILYSPPLEAGEEFVIKGCGLGANDLSGASPGWVNIRFAGTSMTVNTFEWKSDSIHCGISEYLTGHPDQQVTVIVKLYNGMTSSSPPIQYQAAREDVVLPIEDVSISCGGSSYDTCRLYGDGITMEAVHNYGFVDFGADRISASLKNGWKFKYARIYPILQNEPPQSVRLEMLSGFQPGTASTHLDVAWLYALHNYATGIHYVIQLVAEGLRGTSYK